MDVREKLVELIVEAMPPCYSDVFAVQIADHLIAHGVTVPDTNVGKWIPVTERLPEFNQPCLCYKKVHGHPEYRLGTYLGATFSDNCAAFRSMSHFGCIGATHWMPLPEAPKGE